MFIFLFVVFVHVFACCVSVIVSPLMFLKSLYIALIRSQLVHGSQFWRPSGVHSDCDGDFGWTPSPSCALLGKPSPRELALKTIPYVPSSYSADLPSPCGGGMPPSGYTASQPSLLSERFSLTLMFIYLIDSLIILYCMRTYTLCITLFVQKKKQVCIYIAIWYATTPDNQTHVP